MHCMVTLRVHLNLDINSLNEKGCITIDATHNKGKIKKYQEQP